MNSHQKLLPAEVAALVHHVELHRAGWWEKTIHRLIVAAVWLRGKPASEGDIGETLNREFKIEITGPKLRAAIETLESQKYLVRLEGPLFRIPDEKRIIFEAEIKDAEQSAADARVFFISLAAKLIPELEATKTWEVFESEFLAPLVRAAGASAYNLIAGEQIAPDKDIAKQFLRHFDAKYKDGLSSLLAEFLNPKEDRVRTYISRMLHATFCVQASGLPEKVVSKLNTRAGKQINFRIFVDTNFLFSILALHENPSNDAATELQHLITALSGNPRVELFVTSRTIDEVKHSIALAKEQLSALPAAGNFTGAALRAGVSGMAARFLYERRRRSGKLTVNDWFDPYLKGFITIARTKGVELYNERLDGYTTRQDVADDIDLLLKAEARRMKRRKTYEMVEHDMILWHLVKDKRPAYVESPLDAIYWILTVDFRLIAFDDHKQKRTANRVPICLHPTGLIQLLQFWIPRSKEFEEAVLGALRLPFLFQRLDAEAERTSLRILQGIGRFEGTEHLPEDTLTELVLNENLRARIQQESNEQNETAIIREALLAELTARADSHAAHAEKLSSDLRERDERLSALDQQSREKDLAIEELRSRLKEQQARIDAAEEASHVRAKRPADIGNQAQGGGGFMLTQETLIRVAKKTVPSFRLAIAGAGLLALAAVVLKWGNSIAALGLGAAIIFIFAMAFLALNWISRLQSGKTSKMAVFLAWSLLLILVLTLILMLTSAALDWPWAFRGWIQRQLGT